ncbi:unnamed protein product [Phyllotreta striolata]|uniref:Uncharacterized protein n=1 Tax=Phyllotreta striolata TaxID=444603 RepID=A0A9N9TMA6_PHYSR|nr:unnamed protein product [Phyllotreta striolata]
MSKCRTESKKSPVLPCLALLISSAITVGTIFGTIYAYDVYLRDLITAGLERLKPKKKTC